MTVLEWQADVIEGAGKVLAYWVSTTPEDRLRWRPSVDEKSCARCILDQVEECIHSNRMVSALFRGEPPPDRPDVTEGRMITGAEACELLVASASALASITRSANEELLSLEFPTPIGAMTGADLIRIAAAHMSYHGGQVNYIQLLYGDPEFRIPGRA